MFLPYADDSHHTTKPYVNYAIIALNVMVFLWQLSRGESGERAEIIAFGLIPARLLGTVTTGAAPHIIPAWMTIFTSMFMHSGFMHIAGNMLYLWIFGDNIEASLGRFRYLMFYLLSGIAAALTQTFMSPGSNLPMIGASGAIAGVLGAYLVLHPRANVRVFVWLIIYFARWNIPAVIALGFWFVMQLFSSASVEAGEGGVAFAAHVGGFATGAAMVVLFKKRNIPLFEMPNGKPFSLETKSVRMRRTGSVPEAGWTNRKPGPDIN